MRSSQAAAKEAVKTITVVVNNDGTIRFGGKGLKIVHSATGGYTAYVTGLKSIVSASITQFASPGTAITNISLPNTVSIATYNTGFAAADGYFVLTVVGFPKT